MVQLTFVSIYGDNSTEIALHKSIPEPLFQRANAFVSAICASVFDFLLFHSILNFRSFYSRVYQMKTFGGSDRVVVSTYFNYHIDEVALIRVVRH